MGQIRPKAICLFRHKGKLLLIDGLERKINNQSFVTPVGGGVEFGERSEETAVRETREEIGAAVTNLNYLGVIENMFAYGEDAHHEIVFVYEAEFEDKSLYEKTEIAGVEDNGWTFTCKWFDVTWLKEGHVPFYPTGILDLI